MPPKIDTVDTVTLEKHFERMFCELEKRLVQRLDLEKEASQAAIRKASDVLDLRLHNLNQWKDQSQIDRATFFTCKEHEFYKDAVNIRFNNLEQSKAYLEGKASVGSVVVGVLISVAISLIMHFLK